MFVAHVNKMLMKRGVKFNDLIKSSFKNKMALNKNEVMQFFRNKVGTHYAEKIIKGVMGKEFTMIDDLCKIFG